MARSPTQFSSAAERERKLAKSGQRERRGNMDPSKPTMGIIKKTGLQQTKLTTKAPAAPAIKGTDLRGNSGKNIFKKGL